MAENNADVTMAAENAPVQKASQPVPEIEPYFKDLKDEVRMLCRDYSELLYIAAAPGIGKTRNITDCLNEEQEAGHIENYQIISGKITPLALYKKMYRVSGENDVLFLDDVRSVVKNKDNVEFLKNATDSKDENWISYNTSADSSLEYNDGTRCPPSYNFEGKIIICCNEDVENDDVDALKDRGTDFHMSFDHEERIELIHEIAKIEKEDSTYEERKMIADFIEDSVRPGDEPSLRLFDKCLNKYRFCRDFDRDWEEKLTQEIGGLEGDRKIARDVRIECLEWGADRQVKAFEHLTGKTRATFYNYLSEMPDVI